RVIQTGHDPRRFVEDLLERFRDLIIVQAMPESAHAILRGMPADQIARLQNQAHNLGAAELSRAADVTNTALTEMTGATSPRLHLELLCARILLPSSEQNERGMAARIDRVERRLNYAGNDVGAPAASAPAAISTPASQAAPAAQATAPTETPGAASGESPAGLGPGRGQASPAVGLAPEQASPASQPAQEASTPSAPAASAAPSSGSQDSPAAEAPRSPLTPPRVSTSDWPVEEPARPRAQQGPETAGLNRTAAQPNAAPQPGAAPEPQEHRHAPGQASATPATPHAPTQGETQAQERPYAPDRQSPSPQAPAHQTPAGAPALGNQAPAPQHRAPGRPAPAGPPAMGDVEVLRRAWPDVLQALSKIKRSTWALVEPNAQVSAFDGSVLTLSFTTSGLAGAFGRADHSDNLRQAIHRTVGLDCQINAVAGGASQASSEPNPKVPASPVVPATSADVAWGLAPAPAQPASPAQGPSSPLHQAPPTPTTPGTAPGTPAGLAAQSGGSPDGPSAAGTNPSGGTSGSAAVADRQAMAAPVGRPSAATTAETRPAQGANGRAQQDPEPVQTAAGSPGTPRSASGQSPYPSTGGDYSYSDDDWGPPRDEDAPPLDEEPPMDWEPSAGPGNRGALSSPAPGRQPASGQGEAGTRSHGSSAVAPRADSAARQPAPSSAQPADAPHDPWTRAVEQAPGVWVVGDKSNVGAQPVAASGSDNIGAQANVPHYAPATAQVPPSIPVASVPAAGAPGHGWDPASVSGNGHAASATESYQASSPQPAPVPEYAMASAAPAAGVPAAPARAQAPAAASATVAPAAPARAQPPADAPVAGRTETRQSLYQRLSSSPEAEAGRAKAPARAAAAPSTYVQDIPSADDETIEESGVFGRAAVERILGGKLIEERSLDGSPVTPRY
ncbi:MAG TPA: DNA polymerase III subunit gamma and tau, partial [Arthrobacter sp.]